MMSFVRVPTCVSRRPAHMQSLCLDQRVTYEFCRKTVRILNRSRSIFGKRFGCSFVVIKYLKNTVITTICVRAGYFISWNTIRFGILLQTNQINEEHTILRNPRTEIEIKPNSPLNTTLYFGLSNSERIRISRNLRPPPLSSA